MSSQYEFWLCDDAGRRLYLFKDVSSCSYSRSTQGYGTVQLSIPYNYFLQENVPIFRPDLRLDIWRSSGSGFIARREGSFLLRKYQVYQRVTDGMLMYELYGRSPIDILRRQSYKGSADLTDTIDNIMKTIVRSGFTTTPSSTSTAPAVPSGASFLYTGEFAVDVNSSDGPSISDNYYLKNILDACNDLKKSSQAKNMVSSTNKKIYFDVVEDESIGLPGGFGYRFKTYPTLRGRDRTSIGPIFSVDNGNIASPVYYEDYLDEYTAAGKYNSDQSWASQLVQSPDRNLSRWNYIEKLETTSDTVAAVALNDAYTVLQEGNAQRILNADFLDSPGSDNQPRSRYGVDWDLGDLLQVVHAGKTLACEVLIVYVSVTEDKKENVVGKTQVGA